MFFLLLFLHILASLILILVVLLQSGKAADLAGAFGGGGSQTAFGARGAQTILAKTTTGAAVLFMCTSLGLGILSSRQSESIFEDLPGARQEGPSTPAGTPAPVPAGEEGDAGAVPAAAGEEGAATGEVTPDTGEAAGEPEGGGGGDSGTEDGS